MSYFEDCIEPYIGSSIFDNEDILNGDTIDYMYIAVSKETEKAYLINFGSNGSAWIPKYMVDNIENNIVSIYEEFRPRYINKVKTIGIGDIC